MKNKTIIIIAISAIAAIIAVLVLVVLLNKKPATQTAITTPTPSTGTGTVSNGANPDLATLGSGVVAVVPPKTDATQPYATTAPRVEPKPSTGNNTTALQPASGSTQQTASASGSAVAYNYNQADDSFLSQYYPDAQQVIYGGDGPAGNVGQDPSNQVVYVTNPTATGPVLTPPSGFDTSSITTSSDNSLAAIQNYLTQLASTTSSFDIVNNTSLVTDPLQNLDANEATQYGTQSAAILQSLQSLTVPSSMLDLQASFVDAYQQYGTYASQLAGLINSANASSLEQSSGPLETITTNISNTINIASTDYQNAVAFYGGSSTSTASNPYAASSYVTSGTSGGSEGSDQQLLQSTQ